MIDIDSFLFTLSYTPRMIYEELCICVKELNENKKKSKIFKKIVDWLIYFRWFYFYEDDGIIEKFNDDVEYKNVDGFVLECIMVRKKIEELMKMCKISYVNFIKMLVSKKEVILLKANNILFYITMLGNDCIHVMIELMKIMGKYVQCLEHVEGKYMWTSNVKWCVMKFVREMLERDEISEVYIEGVLVKQIMKVFGKDVKNDGVIFNFIVDSYDKIFGIGKKDYDKSGMFLRILGEYGKFRKVEKKDRKIDDFLNVFLKFGWYNQLVDKNEQKFELEAYFGHFEDFLEVDVGNGYVDVYNYWMIFQENFKKKQEFFGLLFLSGVEFDDGIIDIFLFDDLYRDGGLDKKFVVNLCFYKICLITSCGNFGEAGGLMREMGMIDGFWGGERFRGMIFEYVGGKNVLECEELLGYLFKMFECIGGKSIVSKDLFDCMNFIDVDVKSEEIGYVLVGEDLKLGKNDDFNRLTSILDMCGDECDLKFEKSNLKFELFEKKNVLYDVHNFYGVEEGIAKMCCDDSYEYNRLCFLFCKQYVLKNGMVGVNVDKMFLLLMFCGLEVRFEELDWEVMKKYVSGECWEFFGRIDVLMEDVRFCWEEGLMDVLVGNEVGVGEFLSVIVVNMEKFNFVYLISFVKFLFANNSGGCYVDFFIGCVFDLGLYDGGKFREVCLILFGEADFIGKEVAVGIMKLMFRKCLDKGVKFEFLKPEILVHGILGKGNFDLLEVVMDFYGKGCFILDGYGVYFLYEVLCELMIREYSDPESVFLKYDYCGFLKKILEYDNVICKKKIRKMNFLSYFMCKIAKCNVFCLASVFNIFINSGKFMGCNLDLSRLDDKGLGNLVNGISSYLRKSGFNYDKILVANVISMNIFKEGNVNVKTGMKSSSILECFGEKLV